MDALPILEQNDVAHASTCAGVMHACGHDGHTAVLLGAARYLAETRNFDGRVVLIFQPAEAGQGGSQAMLDDGLFERFPCDAIYEIGRAHVGTPVNNAHLVCRLLLDKHKQHHTTVNTYHRTQLLSD